MSSTSKVVSKNTLILFIIAIAFFVYKSIDDLRQGSLFISISSLLIAVIFALELLRMLFDRFRKSKVFIFIIYVLCGLYAIFFGLGIVREIVGESIRP